MSHEERRIRRELRQTLEQWLLNGYLPVAHIVAEPDPEEDVAPLQVSIMLPAPRATHLYLIRGFLSRHESGVTRFPRWRQRPGAFLGRVARALDS